MLPEYIIKDKKDGRHEKYEVACKIYEGNHYEIFNKNEQEYKFLPYEYLCYNIIEQALNTKVDLIWHEKPLITFNNADTQKAFDELRVNTNFDEVMSEFTKNLYLNGDSVLKIAIDSTDETAIQDDYQLCIYNIDPSCWIPDYYDENPSKYPKQQTFVIEKEIKVNDQEKYEAYLFETHKPGLITWTAFQEWKGKEDDYMQVDPMVDWSEELQGVLAQGGQADQNTMEITFKTQCDYSLIQFLRNKVGFEEFFGKSDITLPVMSKLNALNNYSNLADTVIVSNVFPKLLAGEGLVKLMNRIIEEINSKPNENLIPNTLLETPTVQFANAKTYLQTDIWKKFVNESRIIPDEGRGGTKYLQNSFDLEQLRKQHEIFFKAIMNELGISEVLYNSNIASGALSGVAYKRLLTLTINEIEHTKRILEPFMKKLVYTMLQLANANSLITAKPEMPSVSFFDGIVNDSTADLQDLVTKVQNQLIPLKEAIIQANDITEEEANNYLASVQAEQQATQDQQTLVDQTTNLDQTI